MPKEVEVVTAVVPLPVTVAVTTLVAVVLAVQPAQVVHGALVPHGPFVQPVQVEAGQSSVPHHEVHGPVVHAPVLSLAQGPQPWPGRP